MSYDLGLKDPVTGEPLRLDERHYTPSMDKFVDTLITTGVIESAAWYDPENYDGARIAQAVMKAYHALY